MSRLRLISIVCFIFVFSWMRMSGQQKLRLIPTFENCSYYCDSVFDVTFDKAWNTSDVFRLLYKAKMNLSGVRLFLLIMIFNVFS